MDRIADETEYVLLILRQMRVEVIKHPHLFDRNALERIDKAIARIELGREAKAA